MLTFILQTPGPTGRAIPTCVMHNIIIVQVCIIYLLIIQGSESYSETLELLRNWDISLKVKMMLLN